MDRAESGIVDFGKKVKPHDLDTEESYAPFYLTFYVSNSYG